MRTTWPRLEERSTRSVGTVATPVLTRLEENSLRMAEIVFTGLGPVDDTFRRLERWGLVSIAPAPSDGRFWFAEATARGSYVLAGIERRR